MASSVVRPAPLPRIGALRAAGGVSTLAIAVRPDISCLLALGLCAWTFADAVFPAAAPGRGLVAYVATGIVAAGGLITSLVLHEVGHAIVGRWIGLTPRHISLSLFGGVTVFDREPGTPGQACALALAGPVANLLVAVVAGIVHVVLVDAGADPLAAAAAASIVVINLGITLVNLIPALPLDGGHAARAVLGVVLRRPDIAGAIADAIGRALGWTMVGVAVLASASGDAAIAVWAALIGFAVHDHMQRVVPMTRSMSRAPLAPVLRRDDARRVARRPAA